MKTPLPATIRELLNLQGYQSFISDKLGNDLFINDPERADRIHEYAEDGCDGSTHAEHIEDWREYVELLKRDADREAFMADSDAEMEAMEALIESWHDTLSAEIDACEAWHEKAGSLHSVIG